MDTSILDSGPQLDASKLSDSDKRELNQFIQRETQKAKMQECMSHHLLGSLDLFSYSPIYISLNLESSQVEV